MKKIFLILSLVVFLCAGCVMPTDPVYITATTGPVCYFTQFLCQDTPLQVQQLITETVSCLHDYSLSVAQMRTLGASETVIISGAGLEDFMDDLLVNRVSIDCSKNVPLLDCSEEHDHDHGHDHEHEADAHIWLAPENAKIMATNICDGLCVRYPQFEAVFRSNLVKLQQKLDELQQYAEENLADLKTRELITFHDGFAYLADSFDLTIVAAIEEESGSEASAKELVGLISLIEQSNIPAIFTEYNGSVSAAGIIARETGVGVFTLDMAMNGDYFEIMYRNIDTIKEALG